MAGVLAETDLAGTISPWRLPGGHREGSGRLGRRDPVRHVRTRGWSDRGHPFTAPKCEARALAPSSVAAHAPRSPRCCRRRYPMPLRGDVTCGLSPDGAAFGLLTAGPSGESRQRVRPRSRPRPAPEQRAAHLRARRAGQVAPHAPPAAVTAGSAGRDSRGRLLGQRLSIDRRAPPKATPLMRSRAGRSCVASERPGDGPSAVGPPRAVRWSRASLRGARRDGPRRTARLVTVASTHDRLSTAAWRSSSSTSRTTSPTRRAACSARRRAVVAVDQCRDRGGAAAGALVVYTQDWHPEHTPHFAKDGGIWPVHCVAGHLGRRVPSGPRGPRRARSSARARTARTAIRASRCATR